MKNVTKILSLSILLTGLNLTAATPIKDITKVSGLVSFAGLNAETLNSTTENVGLKTEKTKREQFSEFVKNNKQIQGTLKFAKDHKKKLAFAAAVELFGLYKIYSWKYFGKKDLNLKPLRASIAAPIVTLNEFGFAFDAMLGFDPGIYENFFNKSGLKFLASTVLYKRIRI